MKILKQGYVKKNKQELIQTQKANTATNAEPQTDMGQLNEFAGIIVDIYFEKLYEEENATTQS